MKDFDSVLDNPIQHRGVPLRLPRKYISSSLLFMSQSLHSAVRPAQAESFKTLPVKSLFAFQASFLMFLPVRTDCEL